MNLKEMKETIRTVEAKQQKENPTEACTSRSSGERICNLILSVTLRSVAASVLTSTGDMEFLSEI